MAKVARITSLGCSHFVDDLPEILEMLPDTITRFLFAPNGEQRAASGWLTLQEGAQLPELLR